MSSGRTLSSMKISLRQDPGRSDILRRVEALHVDAPAQWGKMNCAQMLAHCQKPFELALGEFEMKRALIGRLIGGWAKKKYVVSDAPFGKNSPTDPTFRVAEPCEFERERAGLVERIERYAEHGVLTEGPHPFFGPLDAGEWDRLLWKHLDHHLRQFGA